MEMKSKKEILQEESKEEEAKLAVFHPSIDNSLRGILHFSETFLRKQEERVHSILKAREKGEEVNARNDARSSTIAHVSSCQNEEETDLSSIYK